MFETLKDRVAKALTTPAGERLLASLEHDAQTMEERVAQRRRLVAQIDAARQRRKTEAPRLDRAVEEAEKAVALARTALEDAERRAHEARSARSSLEDEVAGVIAHTSRELSAAADPRILAAIETLEEAHRVFPTLAGKLIRTATAERLVPPHSSDPNYGGWRAEGVRYRLKAFGSNVKAVDAIRRDMEDALKAARALALVADPPVDLDVVLAKILRAAGPHSAPEMEWVEPKAPVFDSADA
jgi:hypothetical protein